MIKWYHYYSFWIFIWFILYKQKFIKFQPSYNFLLANLFLLYKCLLFPFMKKYKLTSDIMKIYLSKIGLGIVVDLIPLIFLMPLQFDLKTLVVNLLFFVIYLLFMNKTLNYNVKEIINMYTSRTYNARLNNITYMEWLQEMRVFFSI